MAAKGEAKDLCLQISLLGILYKMDMSMVTKGISSPLLPSNPRRFSASGPCQLQPTPPTQRQGQCWLMQRQGPCWPACLSPAWHMATLLGHVLQSQALQRGALRRQVLQQQALQQQALEQQALQEQGMLGEQQKPLQEIPMMSSAEVSTACQVSTAGRQEPAFSSLAKVQNLLRTLSIVLPTSPTEAHASEAVPAALVTSCRHTAQPLLWQQW